MSQEHYRKAEFLKSAAKVGQLPQDEGMEVAFMGCSNSGKSSTLNALTDNKKLARTSKTPGRTQLINLFSLDNERRLVDLPGHGYAKVPGMLKAAWEVQIDRYLRERHCLVGIVLVADIRHPLKPFEQEMIDWALTLVQNIPLLYLLNKSDKLSYGAAQKTLLSVKKTLADAGAGDKVIVQTFSALKRTGLAEFCAVLDEWFQF